MLRNPSLNTAHARFASAVDRNNLLYKLNARERHGLAGLRIALRAKLSPDNSGR